MRKATLILLLTTATLLLSSCTEKKPPEIIPSVGDDTTELAVTPVTSSPIVEESLKMKIRRLVEEELDEQEKLGLSVSEGIGYYADTSLYENRYQIAIDKIYRAKLDIDIYEKIGANTTDMQEYKKLIEAVLEGQSIKYYQKADISALELGYINESWVEDFKKLAKIDDNRLSLDSAFCELISAYYYRKNDVSYKVLYYVQNNGNLFKDFPHVSLAINGEPVEIVSQYYDRDMHKTVLVLSRDTDIYVSYQLSSEYKVENMFVGAGEKLVLPIAFEGEITYGTVTNYGIVANVKTYSVKSSMGEVASEEVVFVSKRLDSAVRKYVSKGDDEKLTVADLADIRSMYVLGEEIYLLKDGEFPTVEQLNNVKYAETNDFSFADIEKFPALYCLEIRKNKIDTLNWNGIMIFGYLSMEECEITDISFLRGANIVILGLSQNNITDGKPIGGMAYAGTIYLRNNPVTDMSLPDNDISGVVLTNTNICDISFVNEARSVRSIDLGGTPIKDVSGMSVRTLQSLSRIVLPDVEDYSVLLEYDNIKRIVVGDKTVRDKYIS